MDSQTFNERLLEHLRQPVQGRPFDLEIDDLLNGMFDDAERHANTQTAA